MTGILSPLASERNLHQGLANSHAFSSISPAFLCSPAHNPRHTCVCLLAFRWPLVLSQELPEDQGSICFVHKCQHTDGTKWGLSIPMN